MLKKYSIINFVLLIIIAVLGILLSVCPFSVPYSTDKYNGFVGAIQKGIDLGGGVSAIYEVELNNNQYNLDETIDLAINKIEEGLDHNADYYQTNVIRQGDNKIRIEVADTQDTDYNFGYLEDSIQILITIDEVSDTLTNPNVYLESIDVQTAYIGYDYDNSSYTIVMELTSQGKNKLKDLKDDANESNKSSAYIYINETTSDNLLSTITISDIGDSITFTSSHSDYSSSSSTSTLKLAYSIISGSLGLNLNLLETSYISPILGQNSLLFIGISCIIFILLSFILLSIRYRHMGLIGCLSLTFYLILFVFFMQAIPFIVLNLASVFGCIFAFILAIIANIFIFEKIKAEYAIGKKIHISFKSGIKKALWPILDSHFIVIFASAMLWIFAPTVLKGFAISLMLGAIISIFTSLVISRYLLKIYLPLNSTKAKKLNLYRDKNVKEIKGDEVVESTKVTNTVEGGNNNG